ncbi:MAG: 30S ribosomal protein S3 [Candidatus Ryanbacteria bacterium CG10_big_fil_rev_8_21_14_0_10_43_42]|uniref:Small ribosomal subunit protein uS3 n=1 Tax=Candidatus Ryanbacteria bacterium CG10_big_fil_rev_8_21_14_0_10_43_42 TaxID=1974864 RepID=A0A2M8KXZ4_9BACT|nr:MAG: 30S ribosomal protein S3 [Candidatus Ryanbacteria bacterium CG10_big_fil_rev_8_21_14_0_10_43_42]
MTHVAHPYGLRLGIINDWRSRWFDKRAYRRHLKVDTLLREFLWKELKGILVDSIDIERSPRIIHIIISTSQPGILIGRGGEGAEKLKEKIRTFVARVEFRSALVEKRRGLDAIEKKEKGKLNVKLTIEEVRSPESRASIVAQMVVQELERRMSFRRVLKNTLEKVMTQKDVEGVKVSVKGRLDGAEMGRHEWLRKGRIPLQTLRADIDYASRTARLPYGAIGVKVWIYRGDIFDKDKKE